MKAIIIDDEQKSIDVLKRLIQESNVNVEITNYAQSVEEGFEIIKKEEPQLIFLDVEMLDGTGFNLLEKFDSINFHVIFTTAYDKYAIKAFKYSAIDYLLKPIDIDDLETAIKKVENAIKIESFSQDKIATLLSNLSVNQNKKIAIKSAQKIDFIDIDEIICFEADYNYSEIHLNNGKKIISSQPLKYFDNLLYDNSIFFRVSRSSIVNLNYVKSYMKDKETIELKNGIQLNLARRKKKEFLQFIKTEFSNL